MLILVLFSTAEGHTRKLAQFAAARLRGCSHEVKLHDAADFGLPDPAEFDAAFLLASVHLGRYHYSFVEFVRNNHNALNAIPTVFVSVPTASSRSLPSNISLASAA
jgi:menaquinone-dependent protoporphyrinogen oxidase